MPAILLNAEKLTQRLRALAACDEVAQHHLTAEKFEEATGFVSKPVYFTPFAVGEFAALERDWRRREPEARKRVGLLVRVTPLANGVTPTTTELTPETRAALGLADGDLVRLFYGTDLNQFRDAAPYREAQAKRDAAERERAEYRTKRDAELRDLRRRVIAVLGVEDVAVRHDNFGWMTLNQSAVNALLAKLEN